MGTDKLTMAHKLFYAVGAQGFIEWHSQIINYYGFSYKKIASAFGARIFKSYLKILARVFDAMMLTKYWSVMKYQFRSWVRIKSDKIVRKFETDWSPCT